MKRAPTSLADNMIVGLSVAHQLVILITVLHLASNSKWPPYVVRNATLVITTGLAGACWAIAIISSFGTYKRSPDSCWAQCDIEVFVLWTSVGMLSNASFLRVYRHWKLLYKKDRRMWATKCQIGILMVPFLIPTAVYFSQPELVHFDPVLQECISEHSIVTPVMGTYCIVLLLASLFLVYTMRHLRKQCNEYAMIRKIAMLILLAPVLFLVFGAITGPNNGALRRQMQIFLSVFITGMAFWIPIGQPVWAFVVKNEKYLDFYTHGFRELPTPAQLRASLADKPTIEELQDEFRRFTKTRVSNEILQFYAEVLDRDTVEDYFERQAVTMTIIDRYVRPDSCDQLKLSDGCRSRVLNSDVTKFDIFEEARLEILNVLKEKLRRDFEETAAYQRFYADVQAQAGVGPPLLVGSSVVHANCATVCTTSTGRLRTVPPVLVPNTPDRADSLCYSSDGYFMYSTSSSEGPPSFSFRSCNNMFCKASPDPPQAV